MLRKLHDRTGGPVTAHHRREPARAPQLYLTPGPNATRHRETHSEPPSLSIMSSHLSFCPFSLIPSALPGTFWQMAFDRTLLWTLNTRQGQDWFMVIGCQDFGDFCTMPLPCRTYVGKKKKKGNLAFPSRNNNLCINCSMENTDSSDV